MVCFRIRSKSFNSSFSSGNTNLMNTFIKYSLFLLASSSPCSTLSSFLSITPPPVAPLCLSDRCGAGEQTSGQRAGVWVRPHHHRQRQPREPPQRSTGNSCTITWTVDEQSHASLEENKICWHFSCRKCISFSDERSKCSSDTTLHFWIRHLSTWQKLSLFGIKHVLPHYFMVKHQKSAR